MRKGVEEFDLEITQADTVPASSSASRRSAPQFTRGPVPWLALAVVLVLLGVIIVARPSSPWQVGMVEQIATPSYQWSAQVAPDEAPSRAWVGDEAVVLTHASYVWAMAVDTGEELWRIEGDDLHCEQNGPDGDVLCASGSGETAELLRLDAVRGEVSRTASPGLIAAVTYDEDVVAVRQDQDRIVLQRLDGDGALVWGRALGSAATSAGQRAVMLATAGERILVMIADSNLTGVLSAVHLADDGSVAPGPDGVAGRILNSSTSPWVLFDSHAEERTYLSAVDGTPSPSQPTGAFLGIDDDPTSDTLLQIDDRTIQARSQRTDALRWEVDRSREVTPIGRVDGLVLFREGSQAVARDEASGARLWTEPVELSPGRVLSDGSTLLTFQSSSDGQAAIGIDVHTGDRVFEVPATGLGSSALVMAVQAHKDRVLVLSLDALTMWSLA